MRMLLTPYIQKELGVVIFKPGSDLISQFRNKMLLSTVPPDLHGASVGLLPNVIQTVIDDPRLSGFFDDERVIIAANGHSELRRALLQGHGCQWTTDDGYHDKNITTMKYGLSAIRLCWHHDRLLKEQASKRLSKIASLNMSEFIITSICRYLKLPDDHVLSFYEICWWAFMHHVVDALPDAGARAALRWTTPTFIPHGVMKESDIRPINDPKDVLEQYVDQVTSVINFRIDPEPPQSFMLKPKLKPWRNEKYTHWVKTQPCVCCGQQSDDPHHIIGHGVGGMGTKTHDLFTLPLCRLHHTELHNNVTEWENQYGDQVELFFKFINHSLGIGVFA